MMRAKVFTIWIKNPNMSKNPLPCSRFTVGATEVFDIKFKLLIHIPLDRLTGERMHIFNKIKINSEYTSSTNSKYTLFTRLQLIAFISLVI